MLYMKRVWFNQTLFLFLTRKYLRSNHLFYSKNFLRRCNCKCFIISCLWISVRFDSNEDAYIVPYRAFLGRFQSVLPLG